MLHDQKQQRQNRQVFDTVAINFLLLTTLEFSFSFLPTTRPGPPRAPRPPRPPRPPGEGTERDRSELGREGEEDPPFTLKVVINADS